MAINAAQHSMTWVNPGEMPSFYYGKTDGINRLGSFLGVMRQSPMDMSGKEAVLDSGDKLTAEKFGQLIAEVTQKFKA
jgi:NAD(P)H dehydrogenase (quinone)